MDLNKRIVMLILFVINMTLIVVACNAQMAFRTPDNKLTIFAPPQTKTTVYDYVVTDGIHVWNMNTYNWRVSIPVSSNRCKVYLFIRVYEDQKLVDYKKFIFYEQ